MGERFYQRPSDCSNGRCYPVIDGGQVYDDMRRDACRPRENPEFRAQTERVFGKEHCIANKDDYRENLFGAAEKGKPIVMMFGRGSDTSGGDVVKALEKAKADAGGKAEFMYVDLDKVDPNSAIGKYARGHIGKDFGTPLTMVFTQHQGEGKTPVIPDRPMHWQKGPLNLETLGKAITDAKEMQKELNTGREVQKPKEPTEPEKAKTKPEDVIKESLKPLKDQKPEDLFKGMSREERFAVIQDSIAKVDALKNPKASAQIRSTIALGVFGLGNEAASKGKADEAKEFFLEGSEYVMSAGVFNKDIYQYPQFGQRLRDTLPGTAGDALLNKGRENPRWMYPDAKAFEGAKTDDDRRAVYTKARDDYRRFLEEQMKAPKRKAA